MILGKRTLAKAFREGGSWHAFKNNTPIFADDLLIGPNSIDVTLHNTFLSLKEVVGEVIDPTKDNVIWSKHVIEDDAQFILYPREVVLASVNERFECWREVNQNLYVPMIEGKSTLGRYGLAIHVTAGFGDYGFDGAFTLELVNHTNYPIALKPGMKIAQVYFIQVNRPALYEGKYSVNHCNGPVPPAVNNV